MRNYVLSAFLLLIAACMNAPSMVLTGDECVANFKRYDVELDRAFINPFANEPRPSNKNRIERLEHVIRNGQCLIGRDEIREIIASEKGSAFRAIQASAATRGQSVHLGVSTSWRETKDFVAYLEELGYSVDTRPGTNLGRRVYLKNLMTDEAVGQAMKLANDMGLKSAYPGPILGLFF